MSGGIGGNRVAVSAVQPQGDRLRGVVDGEVAPDQPGVGRQIQIDERFLSVGDAARACDERIAALRVRTEYAGQSQAVVARRHKARIVAVDGVEPGDPWSARRLRRTASEIALAGDGQALGRRIRDLGAVPEHPAQEASRGGGDGAEIGGRPSRQVERERAGLVVRIDGDLQRARRQQLAQQGAHGRVVGNEELAARVPHRADREIARGADTHRRVVRHRQAAKQDAARHPPGRGVERKSQ